MTGVLDIGDRVRVVEDGDEGVIVRIENELLIVRFTADQTDPFTEDELELIEEQEPF
jgi:hypothetical protein